MALSPGGAGATEVRPTVGVGGGSPAPIAPDTTLATDTVVALGSGGWSAWYLALKNQLVTSRGSSTPALDGSPLPQITAGDCVVILSQVAAGVIRGVTTASGSGTVPLASLVDDTGSISSASNVVEDLTGQGSLVNSLSPTLTVAAYVGGYGVTGSEWIRGVESATGVRGQILFEGEVLGGTATLFTFGRAIVAAGLNDTSGLWTTARGAMAAWQQACNACANIIGNGPGTLQPTDNQAFWSALVRLTSTLDTIDQNPPPSTASLVAGAFNAATQKSKQAISDLASKGAEAASQAAADIANKAAQIAGSSVNTFFQNAGLPVLVIAGTAVYIALH